LQRGSGFVIPGLDDLPSTRGSTVPGSYLFLLSLIIFFFKLSSSASIYNLPLLVIFSSLTYLLLSSLSFYNLLFFLSPSSSSSSFYQTSLARAFKNPPFFLLLVGVGLVATTALPLTRQQFKQPSPALAWAYSFLSTRNIPLGTMIPSCGIKFFMTL
jgi:hypothetical protein